MPRKQSTWHSTVPLRLRVLLATPEWSTEDGYGSGGSGTDGGKNGCPISEFRRQRRLDHDKMYRDAISSSLSTFSQARGSHSAHFTVHSAQCTVHRVYSITSNPYRAPLWSAHTPLPSTNPAG